MTEIKKIYCNTCKGETKHDIKATHDQAYHEEYEDHGHKFLGYYEETEYRFLVCRGCDTATLEEKWTGAGMYDHNGDEIYTYSYQPKRKNLGEREAKRFHHVDKKLTETYKEIIIAFQQGLGIVTAMGVRALLEGICVLEGINDNNAWGLAKKIDHLSGASNIPAIIIEGLNGIKFIGDDAAHRLNTPDKHSLSLSIDLLESLMTHLYEASLDLEHKAELLRKTHNKQKQSDA
ncbi:DUF4145 domain-containing protein [Methylicorpusculum sp.]|uniref:DUF4145 domain-containing protein n=1 Tax=Methylicorpusculum sp. TaxID=2713644 RepID=UPI00271D59C1|nr:DUF4145 domain-containing protein [Methylicorpusculum sp.]MDO8846219.1 DUF4145 domain-containing protein [Methylicorpusculum sp.]